MIGVTASPRLQSDGGRGRLQRPTYGQGGHPL
jgi:hypothetical protein